MSVYVSRFDAAADAGVIASKDMAARHLLQQLFSQQLVNGLPTWAWQELKQHLLVCVQEQLMQQQMSRQGSVAADAATQQTSSHAADSAVK